MGQHSTRVSQQITAAPCGKARAVLHRLEPCQWLIGERLRHKLTQGKLHQSGGAIPRSDSSRSHSTSREGGTSGAVVELDERSEVGLQVWWLDGVRAGEEVLVVASWRRWRAEAVESWRRWRAEAVAVASWRRWRAGGGVKLEAVASSQGGDWPQGRACKKALRLAVDISPEVRKSLQRS